MVSVQSARRVAGAVASGLLLGASAATLAAGLPPGTAERHGTTVVGEWTDAVKTPAGKEFRRYESVYDWDSGFTHRYAYDRSGRLVEERTIASAPRPSEAEIDAAIDIVRSDPEVVSISARQAGVDIGGGFLMQQPQGEGPCVRGTRCLQIFLFDGENVVRQMLVDLRSGKILNRDYIPPRNREDAK